MYRALCIFAVLTGLFLSGCGTTGRPLVRVYVSPGGSSSHVSRPYYNPDQERRLVHSERAARNARNYQRAQQTCARNEKKIFENWKKARGEGRGISNTMKLVLERGCGLLTDVNEVQKACARDKKGTQKMNPQEKHVYKSMCSRYN